MSRPDHDLARPNAPTIFMADDDDVFRTAVARELKTLGYRVVQAADGASALVELAACADGLAPMPDLVLLDVCMPEYSGLGVLSVMRRFETPPPTFIVTGFPDPSLESLAQGRGAARVFHKPVDLDELLAAVVAIVPPPSG